ncbi:MAG: sialidase family protein, partial [Nitrososphaera sp.]
MHFSTGAGEKKESIRKLVLSLALIGALLFSVVSNVAMYAAAQNSTSSTDPSSSNSTSSGSEPQTQDDNSSSQNTTSTNQTATEADATSGTSAVAQNMSSVTIAGEPLLPLNQSMTRSFSYPLLMFEGDVISEVEATLTWNTDGTTDIKDNRGNQFSLAVPKSQGNVSLFANSTVVDQKITGSDLQYDVYWFPVKNSQGYVDKYEFIMAGISENSTSLVIDIVDSEKVESGIVDSDSFTVGNSPGDSVAPESEISEVLDGLALDWSDAIKSGYQASFHIESSSLVIPIESGPFFIDPYVVATTWAALSPSKALVFSDQLRLITSSNGTAARINAFYYDGSNIVYKTSDDHGDTWSAATSLATGTIASDSYTWTVIPSTSLDGIDYAHVFYWTISGSTTTIKTLRGEVNGLNINWGTPVQLSTITNNDSCSYTGTGACVSVSATADSDGIIHAAFNWNTTSGSFSLVIKKSTDYGLTWSDSLPQIDGIATNKLPMTLTPLVTPNVLFVYARNDNSNLFYRVFNGTTWGSEQTISGTGLAMWTRKQLSSSFSDTDLKAYVAYTNVTLTNGGILKVARFFDNGTFEGIETADSSLRHYLPNILPVYNGDININSIANDKIYNTRKFAGSWESPFNPYGTTFNNPDELTATTVLEGENAALWKEGTSSPYNIMFEMLEHGTVELAST